MSLHDFWMNVRTAARFVAPSVVADSPRIDTSDMERALRRAAIWLTPKSVQGFDEQDFVFLGPEVQRGLAEAVRRFREIAGDVVADQPASPEQINQALPEFVKILEILRPDRYADADAFLIGKRVEQELGDRVPAAVAELRFETGVNSDGKPALWIWVVFRDEVLEDDQFLPTANAVRKLLEEAVWKLGFEHWPYVRYRTDSDLTPSVKKAGR